jgi:SAM-dependent methyltransferase
VSEPPLGAAGRTQQQALAFLDGHHGEPPEGVSAQAYDYAVRYTRGRYTGLTRYEERVRKLGFSGLGPGLDIGSGAGHWSVAYALQNAEATGIDTHVEFVTLASGVAEHLGLGDRVRFKIASADRLPFADRSFDAAWSHSVLMYTDAERAIREAARVLRDGGLFYCGYSSFGFRLRAVYAPLAQGDLAGARVQAGNLLSDRVYRAGIHRSGRSAVRALTLDELVALAELFGMTFVSEPQVQDAKRSIVGQPGTVDFLARRERDVDEASRALARIEPGSRLYAELERLIEIGAPRSAAAIIAEREQLAFEDPHLGRLYLRALIKSGRGEDPAARRLDGEGQEPLLRGMLRHEQRRYEEALACYEAAGEGDPRRPLLIAVALLALDRDDEAARWIAAGRADPDAELACRIAELELIARRGELAELRTAFSELLRHLAAPTGAGHEAEALIAELSGGG